MRLIAHRIFCPQIPNLFLILLKKSLDQFLLLAINSIANFQYIENKENRGKGYAIRCGMTKASGDYIIYTDIDFPYSVDSTVAIYNQLMLDKCDVAAGVKDKAYYKDVPKMRKVISKGLQFFTKTLLSLPISRTQCGLKGFKKSIKYLFLETTIDRYLFDIEFLRNAYKKKYKVVPIPVVLNENVVFRKMNYKILLPEILNFVKLLFK